MRERASMTMNDTKASSNGLCSPLQSNFDSSRTSTSNHWVLSSESSGSLVWKTQCWAPDSSEQRRFPSTFPKQLLRRQTNAVWIPHTQPGILSGKEMLIMTHPKRNKQDRQLQLLGSLQSLSCQSYSIHLYNTQPCINAYQPTFKH